MIKVYKASNYLTVPVVMDGKIACYADFNDERFTYRTGDKKVQKALEGLSCFGSLFQLDTVVYDDDKPDVRKPLLKVYEGITDWQDAADLLAKEYGLDPKDLNTPKAILVAAKNTGIEFPNLK